MKKISEIPEEKTIDEEILMELKQIKEYLAPKDETIEEEPKKKRLRILTLGDEFLLFIKKYKILGLAVAFIMATYVGLLVNALVDDIIMPIFQYIPGLNDLDKLADWQVGYFFIGHFISTIITFIIISIVIFIIVKVANKLKMDS